MFESTISPEELGSLKVALKKARLKGGCPKRALRLNFIIALAKGLSVPQIAYALELDEETIRNYVGRYQENGINGILEDGYKGSQSFLTMVQRGEVIHELRTTIYRNTASVQQFILRNFKVNYSRSGMTKLLHELGFSYKKPKKVAFKASIEQQAQFLEEVLEPILLDEKNQIFFMDASHPTIQTDNDYGWFEKGKESIIQSQVCRERLNIIGSVVPKGVKIVTDFPEKVNAESVLKHVLKIINGCDLSRPINIVCDNAKSNVRASKYPRLVSYKNLHFVFLPAYSPNLNLAERLWFLLKKQVIRNNFFDSTLDLKDKIYRKICRWRAFPEQIADTFSQAFHLPQQANVYLT